MHPFRPAFRPVLCVAAAASMLAFVAPSDAAPAYKSKKLVLTDDAGDGNGINGQGIQDIGSVPTPVQVDGLDFVKVEYASTGKMIKRGRLYVPQCTGFTVKMTLSGAPMDNTIYRITGGGVENDAVWWLQYRAGEATIRYATSAESENLESHTIPLSTPAKVVGGTVLFTVLEKDVKASGEKLTKFRITGPGAHDRADLVALTVPEWDSVADYEGDYKPC